MKTRFIKGALAATAAIGWAIASVPAQAQDTAVTDAPQSDAAGEPNIFSPEAVYNFGEWDNETNVDHKFPIVNTGTVPLEIKDVKTSCGCTVAELEKKVLAPGEETFVSATLKLQGKQGQQQKIVTVTSNDPDQPTYQLQFTGTATAAIMYDPQFINLGRIVDDNPHEGIVNIKSTKDDLSFNVTSVESSLENFETEVRTKTAGKEYEVVARSKGPLAPGNLNGNVTIHTDNPKRPNIQVKLFAQVIGAVDVAPETLTLQESDRTTTQFLRVGPGRVTEFEITEVKAPLDTIQVEIIPRGNSNYNIKVAEMPGSKDLEGKELIIKTNLADLPEIKVPFKIIKPITPVPTPAPAAKAATPATISLPAATPAAAPAPESKS